MTATATRPRKINKYLLKIPVRFKNLSVGDSTTTIGFSVDREKLNVEAALEFFCGKRLQVCILVGEGDPSQGSLWDDVQFRVDGIADAKKFSVTPKLVTSGLCFALDGFDVMELTHFAKRAGTLLVVKVNEAAPESDSDDDAENERELEGDDE